MADLEAAWSRRDGRREIDLTDPAAVEFWTARLGATSAKLARAISAVGHSTATVRHWLETH